MNVLDILCILNELKCNKKRRKGFKPWSLHYIMFLKIVFLKKKRYWSLSGISQLHQNMFNYFGGIRSVQPIKNGLHRAFSIMINMLSCVRQY